MPSNTLWAIILIGSASQIVSIIMPTKGRIDLVRRAVRSVLEQTYGAFELLILDDSSEGEAIQIMELANSDTRIAYVDRGGIGVSEARALGVSKARGSFVTFLDSDDYWAKGRLKAHTDVWADHKIGLSWDLCQEIGGPHKLVRPPFSGGLIKAPRVARKLFLGNFIHASSGFTRTGFAQQINFTWTILSDWLLFMKLAESRSAFFVDEPLSFRSVEQGDRVSDAYPDTFFFKESCKVRRKSLLANPAVYFPVWVERSWLRFKRKIGV